MAIFGGKFVCRPLIGLQCRVILIPWMKKSCGIRCSSDSTNSSSFPVRYIPKKTSKTEQSQISAPMKGHEEVITKGLDHNVLRFEVSNDLTSLTRSVTLGQKSQSHVRRSIQFLTHDINQEVEEGIDYNDGVVERESVEEPKEDVERLAIHQNTNYCSEDALQAGKNRQNAEKLAIELLGTRAFTVVELRKKLLGNKFALDTIDSLLKNFQSRGLINDTLYAEAFSQSKWSTLSWGPRRIKQALVKKGVSEADAEKAIKLVFQDNDSSGDQESRLGLSKVSMDHLFVQVTKQWLRSQDVTNEKRKSRIIRWLQYRGFGWGVIDLMLKKLESEYPH
ncbi:uncharacterized protein LOC127811531 isoform X1 [Diospyros lotus]|uniref:uncharacterized protein LOC127811531 isoform X1 n=1 Tax=Diospyros lotus TaxID=55363 RepID=UPI00225B5900|nr:uncharacterized protein LOC127811531 isoform X1 [Diospyros lotus]